MVSREAALLNECITMMDQPFEEEDAFPAAPSSYAAEFAPLQRLRSISQEARPHFDPSIEDSLSPQDSLSAAGATPALGGQVLDAGPLQGTASVQPGLTHPQFVDASTPYPPARFDGHAPGLGRLNPEWRNGGGAEGYVQGHVPAGSSGVAVEKLGRRKSSSEADSAFGTWSTFEDHNGVDVWPHRVSSGVTASGSASWDSTARSAAGGGRAVRAGTARQSPHEAIASSDPSRPPRQRTPIKSRGGTLWSRGRCSGVRAGTRGRGTGVRRRL